MLKKIIKYVVMIFFLTSLMACIQMPGQNRSAIKEKRRHASDIDVRLGMKYIQQNNVPMAKKSFLKALANDPKSPAAWYAMGYFWEATGKLPKAEYYYRHAIRLAPRSGIAHNNYGTFLCRHGQYRKAIEQFMIATKQRTYIDTAGAYENAGLCASLIPDSDAAIAYFRKAIKSDPNHPTSLLELSKLYYEQGDLLESKEFLLRYQALAKPTVESKRLEQLLL